MTVHVNVNTSLQEFTLQNQAGQSKAEHVTFGKDFKLNCHVTCFGPLGIFFFFNYICDRDVSTEKNIPRFKVMVKWNGLY